MNLNALLADAHIDPRTVLVMRHRPFEPELRKVLLWLAAEKPDVFNAYQQTQSESVENAMLRAKLLNEGWSSRQLSVLDTRAITCRQPRTVSFATSRENS